MFTAKWVTLALAIVGVVLFILAARLNKTASFQDGSFIGVILLIIVGVVAELVAAIIFLTLTFQSL